MTKKDLNPERVATELTEQSVFFKGRKRPYKKSPTVQHQKELPKAKPQTNRVTDLQADRVTESGSHRLTDFDDYEVPHYRELERTELWLTWDQKKFLDDLEAIIARDRPEGEREDPDYKRITKNSIIRALVEVARRLTVTVDARDFKNEKDLVKAVSEALTNRVTDLQTDRVPE